MMRVGFGYDVHQLVLGRQLILGGVAIPFERGLLGHSDADVLCHAIGDALLGAAALGDLGKHFPDSDKQYAGISSLVLLEKISQLVTDKNYIIVNIDAVVVAERPRLASYIEQMRMNIAQKLHLPIDSVSIKATTTEGLGFTGTGAGIASYAVVSIQQK
ncbi:2-C-methyl-D-erythritol 2,4-cyclodiphosphate synthase [candidate division KSB1 bacterium]|nr:2-C-methyl-D-erythritol 2,4-cyclodiphosphate synthase [candidate division KSB1 bacterium]